MPSSNQPDIWFYHLTRGPLMSVLPALLMQVLKRKWRCVVQTTTVELMQRLDSDLWTFSDTHFIPHGKAGEPQSNQQPIYITCTPDDRPNKPDVILCTEAAPPPLDAAVERIIVVFDANKDEELTSARTLWKDVTAHEIPASYWTQTTSGGWEKKSG